MARSTLLNTDTEDLKELLSNGKSYSVPPYQRDYSWKEEPWEDLWEDLLTSEAHREDHYMGALVLESGERKQFRIIDGQQRMATLSVLILACVDYLYALANEGVDASANKEASRHGESCQNSLGVGDLNQTVKCMFHYAAMRNATASLDNKKARSCERAWQFRLKGWPTWLPAWPLASFPQPARLRRPRRSRPPTRGWLLGRHHRGVAPCG